MTVEPNYKYYLKDEVQPRPIHNNPSDYGKTDEWGYKRRLMFLKECRRPILSLERELYTKSLQAEGQNRQFYQSMWREQKEKLDKINMNIKYVTKLCGDGFEDESKSFDITALKQIPIDTIVNVNAAGFFKIRDEKTPSVKFYKNNNTWHDFGSDQGGDVIDLVQLINKCSFQDACKLLGGK